MNKLKSFISQQYKDNKDNKYFKNYLLFMIFILACIHIMYKIPAPIPFLAHVWEAGDVITFIGTVVLGYITYKQNMNANETNRAILSQQKKEFEINNAPRLFCYLENFKNSPTSNYMTLVVENVGNSIARDISIKIDGINYCKENIDEFHNTFYENFKKLQITKFSLKPKGMLRTLICEREHVDEYIKKTVFVEIKYKYTDFEGKEILSDIEKTTLSIDEFDLFNLVESKRNG